MAKRLTEEERKKLEEQIAEGLAAEMSRNDSEKLGEGERRRTNIMSVTTRGEEFNPIRSDKDTVGH